MAKEGNVFRSVCLSIEVGGGGREREVDWVGSWEERGYGGRLREGKVIGMGRRE